MLILLTSGRHENRAALIDYIEQLKIYMMLPPIL